MQPVFAFAAAEGGAVRINWIAVSAGLIGMSLAASFLTSDRGAQRTGAAVSSHVTEGQFEDAAGTGADAPAEAVD
ncbi:hypothetical protein P6F26_05905 [Roseibacterium sp. SDUM158017]|uniref:hypothetical protein n=1 Tax=Roseicyclus salinarum TaxID=3036773 RepID=UPI0024155FF4|nr:hypothetical protein [Roseibacterium sp. SDUM158017]MDG4647971.1 hypothetical protein [Roseibacterium sp. SDUM158017]